MRSPMRSAGFATHLPMLALASVLACQAVHRPRALPPLHLHATLDTSLDTPSEVKARRRTVRQARPCGNGRCASPGGASGGRLGRGGLSSLAAGLALALLAGLLGLLPGALGEPGGLGVGAGDAHAGAGTPRAGDLRRGAPEVGDHLT